MPTQATILVSLATTLVAGIVVPILLSPSADAAPRLEYAVILPPLHNQCTSSWIVPGPVAEGTRFPPRTVPSPGVLGAGSAVEVIVQEVTDRTAVLHSIGARVVGREAPQRGLRLFDSGCGAVLQPIDLKVDLDESAASAVVNDTELATPPFPWTVTQSDPVAYSVRLDVTSGTVLFVLELDWSWGDSRELTVIDDGGEPFAVSSTENTTLMCERGGGWVTSEECAD
ncbi:hypothetical protein Pen01_41100 [Phytomonospora endophytica]|nr:hypothetical protein Pen01_41100 [Phytomonospora endophytica]